jgi:cytoskeletal protein CcmA (bactofilin family)
MSAAAAPPPRGAPVAPETTTPTRVRDRGTVRHDRLRARRWEVDGIAKVVGAVEVGSARLRGTVVVGGPLAAVELAAVGRVEVRGPLTVVGSLAVRGSLDAGATVRAGSATLDGPVRTGGAVTVDGPLRVDGGLLAPSVRCGRLTLRGPATVPGTVAAGEADATLGPDAAIGAIVCGRLTLRGPTPSAVDRVLGKEPVAWVGRVEAETASVEGVRVGFLRAREIVLGRGAHVGTVEGRVVRAHPASRVGPESWTPPPPGLRR